MISIGGSVDRHCNTVAIAQFLVWWCTVVVQIELQSKLISVMSKIKQIVGVGQCLKQNPIPVVPMRDSKWPADQYKLAEYSRWPHADGTMS